MSFTQEEAIAKGGKPFRLKNHSLAEEGVPPGAIGIVIYAKLPDFRRKNVWEVLVRFPAPQGVIDHLYDKDTFDADLEEPNHITAASVQNHRSGGLLRFVVLRLEALLPVAVLRNIFGKTIESRKWQRVSSLLVPSRSPRTHRSLPSQDHDR